MTDSSARTESLGDSADDSQLRIKIPNPKIYLARQSQWKGRRGKPRCDHCRLNNLKCDRVLPTCNHCSWATRECKYTPLPTPAHRGIPRCDRCRFHNLKCDRNLPICNFCTEDDETECNYTPKKRHKVPTDHGTMSKARPSMPYAAKTASFLVSDVAPEERYSTGNWIMEHPEDGVSPDLPDGSIEMSSESDDSDDDGDDNVSPSAQAFLAKYEQSWAVKLNDPRSLVSSGPSGSRHRYESSLLSSRHIEPWYHPAFAPLPRSVLQNIRTVSPAEVPRRQDFDEALFRFLAELPIELREVSAFAPDPYAELARSVAKGDMSATAPRISSWISIHHVRPGSRKYHLLVMPRDSHYSIKSEKEERLRNGFIADVDGESSNGKAPNGTAGNGLRSTSPPEAVAPYIRIPVSPQIYDVLVFAHKEHSTTSATLAQIRQAGIACITWPMVELFHRLCPVCIARARASA
ncbi:hypothetical protein FA95DRAFT_1499393 [Auriscalpium vulgare]|uniref:Uncharacterized protein n=1 Tax=Auriscalpium vulgare TaxID=40419 RepID=A0ACB8RG82_9AGAM|nr:hypothetical protein FA95DRAFT_1499393 [Auriscalpium vulgare]